MTTSGLYKVDNLLSGNDALHRASSNVIRFSFSTPNVTDVVGETALNDSQKGVVRSLLGYVSEVTGIVFQEASGLLSNRAIHFGVGDIVGSGGLCEYLGSQAFAIYINTVSVPSNANFASAWTRALLLHEIGHALGLDHPDSLPASENSSTNTLMSYNWSPLIPTTFRPYDLLALSWIYGGDGIGGTWGYNSTNGPVLPPEAYPPITHDIGGSGGVAEGGSYTFTITRAGNTAVATTIAWAVSGGVDAADFGGTLPSGVVSFAAGELSKTVTFNSSDDLDVEPDEGFVVTLGARTGNGAMLGSSTSAAFVIRDNDTPPVVSISPEVRVTEGNAGTTTATFVISRTGNLGRADTVTWSFSHGSSSNADFAPAPPANGSVSFAPGQATAEVSFSIAGDTAIEATETFFVDLSSLGWGTYGNARGVGLIVSDDVNHTFTIAPQADRVVEGQSGERVVAFTVSRSGVVTNEASVVWLLEGAVNADDLASGQPTGGQLSFAAGQTEATLSVRVKGDPRIEADEPLTVRLLEAQGLGAGLGGAVVATTVIANDDPKGEVSVRATSPASVLEGPVGAAVTHTFLLTRNGDLSQAAVMPWRVGGTVNAADFGTAALPAGQVTFAAGSATASVSVTTRGDALFEDNETLSLLLSEGDLVVPSATQGTASVVLLNDDEPNEVRIRAVQPALLERSVPGVATSFQFEVTRIGDLTAPATVNIEVVGSGDFPADAQDFVGGRLPAVRVQLNAGERSKTFFVEVAQDTLREPDETFTAVIRSAAGATVSETQGSATATILTDEPLPGLSVSAPAERITEGQAGPKAVTFTVSRDLAINEPSAVQWSLGGAVDAADLLPGQALQGQVSFAAFETRKTVTVQISGDEAFEPDEALTLTLLNPVNAVIVPGQDRATVLVTNDDNAVRIVQGTAATNEKVVLAGPRADYVLNYEPASGTLRVVDQVLDRDGDVRLQAIEAVQFANGLVKALPSSTELKVMQLAQAVLGPPGMSTAVWGNSLALAQSQGVPALAAYAAELLFAPLSAADMAQAVLFNLNVTTSTLQGPNRQADYAWTVGYLTELFSGNAAVRGAALVAVAEALGGLESHPTFGRAATSFNDNIGRDWVDDLSGAQATLVGLPAQLEPFPIP